MSLCTFVDRYQHFGGTGFKNDPDDGGSRPSDMLTPVCQIAWCHFPEHCNVYTKSSENLKISSDEET